MHNHSIVFLFLVFRDIIVANKGAKLSFSPLTFDMQVTLCNGYTA